MGTAKSVRFRKDGFGLSLQWEILEILECVNCPFLVTQNLETQTTVSIDSSMPEGFAKR